MAVQYTILVDNHPVGELTILDIRGSGYRQVLDLSVFVNEVESRHSVSVFTFASDPLGTLLPIIKRCSLSVE